MTTPSSDKLAHGWLWMSPAADLALRDSALMTSSVGARRLDRLCTANGVLTLDDLVQAQSGVALRHQLYAVGLTEGRLRAQVRGGRWQRLTADVFVMHNGPLTEVQQWWAATLAVGPLAGRTSLAAWGLTGWPSEQIEVLVPKGDRRILPSGVPIRVHESRRVTTEDLHPVRRPARLTVERSAIDAAAWTKTPRGACGLLAAVVQQRLTVAPKLAEALTAAGSVRHVRLLRTVLSDIGGGAQAMSEVDLAGVCRRYGLVLERQLVRLDGEGKRRYVDAKVSAPGGRSVLVEVDGALHLVATTYWADMSRGNELVISQERVLRFPSIALKLDEATVGNQLRRACGLDPVELPAAA